MWLEKKYINLVSPRLEQFKWKSPNLANFRCPLCHDSASNKRKKRGYFYEKEGTYLFHCHNACGTMRFTTFLKELDSRLYQEMKMEQLAQKRGVAKVEDYKFEQPEKERFDALPARLELEKLRTIFQLPEDHPARKYFLARKLPPQFMDVFRYAPEFKIWTNALVPEKFQTPIQFEEGRIVIPYFNKREKFFAFSGRAITDNGVRYIKIVLDETVPQVFGLDRVNPNKDIFVFEGEFDSCFFENAVAVGGQNLNQLTKITDPGKFIVIFDNEPRSSDTIKKITTAINHGFSVCIWPDNLEGKDVNKMILNGYSADHLKFTIVKNTFSGMKARIRLREWSKR